jgi:hypothetical protein
VACYPPLAAGLFGETELTGRLRSALPAAASAGRVVVVDAVLRRASPLLLGLLVLALAAHLGMVMSHGGPMPDPTAEHASVVTTGHGHYHADAAGGDDGPSSGHGMHLMALCLAVLAGATAAAAPTDRPNPLVTGRMRVSTQAIFLAWQTTIPPPTPLPLRIAQGVLLRT